MFYNKEKEFRFKGSFIMSFIIGTSSARSRFEQLRPKLTEHSGGVFFRFAFFDAKESEQSQWMEQDFDAGVSGLETAVGNNGSLADYAFDKVLDIGKYSLFQSGALGQGVANDFAGQNAFDLAGGIDLSFFKGVNGGGVGMQLMSDGLHLDNGQNGYSVGNLGADLTAIGNSIASAATWAGNAIGDMANWAVNAVGDAANWAGNAVSDTANFVANAATSAANTIGQNAWPFGGTPAQQDAAIQGEMTAVDPKRLIAANDNFGDDDGGVYENGLTLSQTKYYMSLGYGLGNSSSIGLADSPYNHIAASDVHDPVVLLTQNQQITMASNYGISASDVTGNTADNGYSRFSSYNDLENVQQAREMASQFGISTSDITGNTFDNGGTIFDNPTLLNEAADALKNRTNVSIDNLINESPDSLHNLLNGYKNNLNSLSSDDLANNYFNYRFSNDNQMSNDNENQNSPNMCFPTSIATALSNLGVENPVAAAGVNYADLLYNLVTKGDPAANPDIWESGPAEVNMVNTYFGNQVEMGWEGDWNPVDSHNDATFDNIKIDFDAYQKDIDNNVQIILATALTGYNPNNNGEPYGHVGVLNSVDSDGIYFADSYGVSPYMSGQKNTQNMDYTYGANEFLNWNTIYSSRVGYYGAFYIKSK
jgi:hypothetical protein